MTEQRLLELVPAHFHTQKHMRGKKFGNFSIPKTKKTNAFTFLHIAQFKSPDLMNGDDLLKTVLAFMIG